MGLTQTAAVGMSKGIVELAGDIASFANVDPSQALQDLQSGLAGEVEPLRKYGISLDEVSLKQKAQQLGLSDGKAVLTANAKAQAAYAIIMESSARITGDFDRTSQGLANQQRIMGAEWVNLKATIGQAFLPAAAEAANVVSTKLLPAMTKFAETVGPKVGTAIADFIAALDGVGVADTTFGHLGERVGNIVRTMVDDFTKLSDWFKDKNVNDDLEKLKTHLKDLFDLIDAHRDIFNAIIVGLTGLATAMIAAKTAGTGLSLVSSGLNGIAALLPLLISPLGLASLAIAGLGIAAYEAYQKIPLVHDAVQAVAKAFQEGGFGAAVDEAGTQFGKLWDVVRPKLEDFLTSLTGWIADQGTAVKDKFVTEWAPKFGDWVADTAVPALLGQLPGVVDAIIGWIRDNEPKMSEAWKTAADSFWTWINDQALPMLQEHLPVIIDALTQFAVDNIPRWGALLGLLFLDALGHLAVLFLDFVGRVVFEFPQQLLLLGVAMIGGLAVGLANGFADKVVPFFANLGSTIIGALSDAGSWLVSTGAAILGGLWSGIQAGAVDVANFFTNLLSSVLNWIGSDPIGWLIGHGENLIHGLVNGIQNVIGDVISFFADLPGNIVSWLGGTGGTLNGQGSDFIHGLLNGVTGVIGEVSSFFANLPGNIVSWIGDTYSTLVSKGGDVIRGFIDGIESWVGSIAGHISAIPGHVSSAIGDLGSLLYDKGASLIRGFVDGIESLAGAAASAVGRVVASAAGAVPGGGLIAGLLKLAGGGFITKPTLALVGEAGPEYVIPADMFPRTVAPLPNTTYAAGMPAASSGSSVGPITVNAQTNADPFRIANELSWALRVSGV